MTESFNPYEVLGVAPTATSEEIRTAFRRKIRQYHPDVNTNASVNLGEMTQRITRAYELIGDQTKRLMYDRTGRIDLDGDKVIEEAKNMLRQMFMNSFDSCPHDPISSVKMMCLGELKKVEEANQQIAGAIAKIEKAHKGLNSKAVGKASFIHNMMEVRLTELRQGRERNLHVKSVVETAQGMIEDFDFTAEPQMVMIQNFGGTVYFQAGPGTGTL